MKRRVFFSFEFKHDVTRAMVVRKSWMIQGKEDAGFIDAAEFEKVKKGGDAAIKRWIREQLRGTSVTVVLVGSHTCSSKFVKYEIEQSKEKRNGLLEIDISRIKDFEGNTSNLCGRMLLGYPSYHWIRDDGHNNMGNWIEEAARATGQLFPYDPDGKPGSLI